MTATPQSVRGGQSQQQMSELQSWQTCNLPVDINTEVKSKTFIKKVMRIAFSNVCYLRTNFPEDVFKNADIGSRIQIRMLRKSNCGAANTMIENLRGAEDAFERGYLKQLEIVIRQGGVNGETSETILETYTFDLDSCNSQEFFTAMLKSTSTQSSTNISLTKDLMMNKNERATAMQLLRKATRSFMRELNTAVEGLEMLPDSAVMEMHLVYTPDTPDDYTAPGYETTTEAVKITPNDNQTLFKKKLKTLPTPYHKVRLGVKSILPSEETKEAISTQNLLGVDASSQKLLHAQESVGQNKEVLNTTEEADSTTGTSKKNNDLDVSLATTVPVPESISTIAAQEVVEGDNFADRSTIEAGSPDYISPTPSQRNPQKKVSHHGRGDAGSALADMPRDQDVNMMDEAEDEGSVDARKQHKQQARKSKSKRKRAVQGKENDEDSDAYPAASANKPAKRAKAKRSQYV